MKKCRVLTDFPETLCTICVGNGTPMPADRFIALGTSNRAEHKGLESVIYVPFCYNHVDIARSRIPEGHMANDMPDLVIEASSDGI